MQKMSINSQSYPKKAVLPVAYKFSLPSKLCDPCFAIPEGSYCLSRNIPHPKRVRHMKGLNDAPICHVKDEGYFPRRLSHEISRFLHPDRERVFQHILSGKNIRFMSDQRHTDAITRCQNYPHEAKGLPRLKLWKEEVSHTVDKAGLPIFMKTVRKKEDPSKRNISPSLSSGFNSPPVSRVRSRQFMLCCNLFLKNPPDGAHLLDYELNVISKLCEILQTDSLTDVQYWLSTASNKEKEHILDMIHSALTLELLYSQQDGEYKDTKRACCAK
ncbi:uncharacterized protein C4orf17 homolog [Rhinatrema bivittatum]|uniref:uncharacterized protein C4orf17 homolog n=1 Tax=Rhinatrema bivittatum TaxID=194408 RepID=UPI001127053C|nr:uncharacterized protein C4orf17 homolog [Rhinatrema bivittatum]XP_029453172.1 uncharacterized protein C4orf17 homolog [Rhinatrema bivittatum]XP_029453182.1 uncharacterized protein C4orf17 homolog [Rhinatrema bivittatum]